MKRRRPPALDPPIYCWMRTPRDFGRRMAALRDNRAIPQAVLAKRVGISRQLLTDFEHGKPSIEFGLVMRTCTELGVELFVKSVDPMPDWCLTLKHQAETKAYNIEWQRRQRRAERRLAARMKREEERLGANGADTPSTGGAVDPARSARLPPGRQRL